LGRRVSRNRFTLSTYIAGAVVIPSCACPGNSSIDTCRSVAASASVA
jgi:hypothetical protein